MSVGLSIIIPAYNEERRIGRYLKDILAFLEEVPGATEVIVVDDGSIDGTVEVVHGLSRISPRVRLISLGRNYGKGAAVRRGMLEAAGARRFFADADGSVPFGEARKLLESLDGGADVAVGSRAFPDRSNIRAVPLRVAAGKVLHLLQRVILDDGVRDTQCGFKAFTDRAALALFPPLRERGFAFDIEVLHRARRDGLRVVEVPVDWRHRPGARVNLVADGLRMLVALLRLRFRPAP